MHDNFKKVALAAIKKSGQILLKRYEKFSRDNIKLKSNHEIVTACDLESERIITLAIKKAFADHEILSEESGDNHKTSDYLWIIDPIDGTTNFSMHNPLWSISVALAYKEEIILGIIYAPCLEEVYIAEKDKGFKINNKTAKVSLIKSGKVLNTFCHGRTDEDIKKAIDYYGRQKLRHFDCRQLGSAAIELAYVASGRIESIFIPGANLWDVAAGVLMVREAGGVVTDFSGHNWNLNSKELLASNGLVHEDLLSVARKL